MTHRKVDKGMRHRRTIIQVDIQVAYNPTSNGPVVQIKSMLEHPVRLAGKYNFRPDFGQKFFISLGVVEKFCVRPNFMPPPTSSYSPMGGLTEFCDENQHDSEANCEDYGMNEDECTSTGRCIWDNERHIHGSLRRLFY